MNMLGKMTAAIAGMVMMAGPVLAANFALSPVDVTISHRQRSQLIVVTNQDNVPLRFQLSANRWEEHADGQMILAPTDDVIFFPQLFDIGPHDSQNVRVGVLSPAIGTEKTYRLVLHQLKAFEPPRPVGIAERSVLISVLTNVSIPVFAEPPVAVVSPALGPLTVKDGKLSFAVSNSGNTHFKIAALRVEGFGAGAQPVFSRTAQGWYVLAGGSRDYELALPSGDCSRVTRLNLQVETDHGKLLGEAPVSPGECGSN